MTTPSERTSLGSRAKGPALMILAVLLSLVPAAKAEATGPAGPPPAPAGGPPDGPPESMRRELLERLSTERAWRLVEGLKLDQPTAAKIFPILSKYDELFFALFSERRNLATQLQTEMAAATPNNARLTTLVDKLLALRDRRHALEAQRLAELRHVLTPWQQARLFTLLPQIEGGFLRRIRHARGAEEAEGEPPGPGGPGHHGPHEGGPGPHGPGGFPLDEPF